MSEVIEWGDWGRKLTDCWEMNEASCLLETSESHSLMMASEDENDGADANWLRLRRISSRLAGKIIHMFVYCIYSIDVFTFFHLFIIACCTDCFCFAYAYHVPLLHATGQGSIYGCVNSLTRLPHGTYITNALPSPSWLAPDSPQP